MKRAVYPGTFDPITFGHIDIIRRAAVIFDDIIIAVVKLPAKSTLFSYKKRVRLVKNAIAGIKNIRIEGFSGLVVDFAAANDINVIVRGLRMISDFEYEFQMALTNRKLSPGIETIFLMPHPSYSYLSSRLVKEIALLGGDLSDFLPTVCTEALREEFKKQKTKKSACR